jgi:chemotaxis protein MotB
MPNGSKQVKPEEASGAPEWMVTFSDCMTLLLTFFVLLLSFSSFDENVFEELSVAFLEGKPSVGQQKERRKGKDAFLLAKQIDSSQNVMEGSEKSTLARRREGKLKEETESVNFHRRKVFLISSKRIFWGRGTVISSEGRDVMVTMASFLREMPSRVVISENEPADDEGSRRFGLLRAWAVVEYLTRKQNLDKRWFSIAASTLAQEGPRSDEPAPSGSESERTVEIVLLERSIYN